MNLCKRCKKPLIGPLGEFCAHCHDLKRYKKSYVEFCISESEKILARMRQEAEALQQSIDKAKEKMA